MTQAQRGRILVLLVCALVLGVWATAIFLANFPTPRGNIEGRIIRFLITLMLCVALYIGKSWARWLLTVLFFAAGILSTGIAMFRGVYGNPFVLFLVLGAAYFIGAMILALSSSIGMFLRYQRSGLMLTTEPDEL